MIEHNAIKWAIKWLFGEALGTEVGVVEWTLQCCHREQQWII